MLKWFVKKYFKIFFNISIHSQSVPRDRLREYTYAYGAVDTVSSDYFFLVIPACDTHRMNLFLKKLSEGYPDDMILLYCDNAGWHKFKTMIVPENIELFRIPPYTPEMNPIEQIWKELRQVGFRSEIFLVLKKL